MSFLVLITDHRSGIFAYTALFSSLEKSLEYVKNWFKLTERPTYDNYLEKIPENVYCSIDILNIDIFSGVTSDAGCFHEIHRKQLDN